MYFFLLFDRNQKHRLSCIKQDMLELFFLILMQSLYAFLELRIDIIHSVYVLKMIS